MRSAIPSALSSAGTASANTPYEASAPAVDLPTATTNLLSGSSTPHFLMRAMKNLTSCGLVRMKIPPFLTSSVVSSGSSIPSNSMKGTWVTKSPFDGDGEVPVSSLTWRKAESPAVPPTVRSTGSRSVRTESLRSESVVMMVLSPGRLARLVMAAGVLPLLPFAMSADATRRACFPAM